MQKLLVTFFWLLACGAAFAAPRVDTAYSQIPLAFTLNQGQSHSSIRFTAQGSNCGMAFSPTGTTFLLSRETAASVAKRAAKKSVVFENDPARDTPEYESFALKLAFVGANENPEIQGEDRLPWNNNYFIGNDPEKWRTDVPNYKKVRLTEVYNGIDLVYYGNQKRVKYDFVVKPGEDPKQILLKYDFGQAGGSLVVNEKGELVVKTPVGELVEEKPYCYQKINGKEVEVQVAYEVVEGGMYRFRVGEYDKGYDLVIDPELVFSTYLGGIYDEQAVGVAIDKDGCVYVVGKGAPGFPVTPGALDSTATQMFITKISSDGKSLMYSTFLGSKEDAMPTIAGIDVDGEGNAYVAGSLVGKHFPTTAGAFDTSFGELLECFITKINAQGNGLVYSTFLDALTIEGITIDGSNNVYVAGTVNNTQFPTTPGAYRTSKDGDSREGFLTKLNKDGSGLVYSTLLGKIGWENVVSVKVDALRCAYVVGNTRNPDYPVTVGSFQSPGGESDIFATKISVDGSLAIYSALFGGSMYDFATDLAIDDSGNAYICGYTESKDYPVTPGAFQDSFRGKEYEGILTKLNSEGSALVFSTFIGGTSDTQSTMVNALALNQSGSIFISGISTATFPVTTDAYQRGGDIFLTLLSPSGNDFVYSTYFGGSNYETVNAVASDRGGNVVIVGLTTSIDFPITAGSVDEKLTYFDGSIIAIHPDAFISKFHFGDNSSTVGALDTPSDFSITGVYPNPFNPFTTIGFYLPDPGKVTFSVYTVSGQKLRDERLTYYERGYKQIRFDGKDRSGHPLSSGVYMIRLEQGKYSDSRKISLMK